MEAILTVIGAFIFSLFVVAAMFWIWSKFNKSTNGQADLDVVIKDYGYSHYLTIDYLKTLMANRILYRHGYDVSDISVYYEIGHKYTGRFRTVDSTEEHTFVIETDGWHLDYSIDNMRMQTWDFRQ